MTENEFMILVAGMKSVYTSDNFLPDENAMKVWFRLLNDLPYELAEAAIYKHMSISHFPPTIADIREKCAEVQQGEQKDWIEGWSLVMKNIHRYGWSRPEAALNAIREVDPVAARTAAMLGWQNLCESENQTADRANFRQCYETAKAREKENAKLPPMVLTMLQSVAHNLQIGDGNHVV